MTSSQSSTLSIKAKVLQYVRLYHSRHGFSPSIRDIVNDCGISSTSVVAYNLKKLEEDGVLSYTPGLARSIVLHQQPCKHTGQQRHVQVCCDCGHIIREEQPV